MKVLKLCALVGFLGMPVLAHAQAKPTQATVNFLNSLIYETMTTTPVWSQNVNYTSSESHRHSYVRKQGAVTCTATKYLGPQYSGLQAEYHCDFASAGLSMYGMTIIGEAAELAYTALSKFVPKINSAADDFSTLPVPMLGTVKVGVSGWVCEEKCRPKQIQLIQSKANGTNAAIIECGLPGSVQKPLAHGEFFDAEKAGALEFSPNSYSCVVSLK